MSRSAAILLTDADALARLRSEGGLLEGFLESFGGSLDDTVRPDGRGLDRLLHDHAVVALDRNLLLPQDPSGPPSPLLGNLLAKVAGRLSIRLVVLSGTEEEAAGCLHGLLEERGGGCGTGEWRSSSKAILVVILAGVAFSSPLRRAVSDLLESNRYRAIYLMAEVLQRARDTVVRAENVWPILVGRLLVALSARPDQWWDSWDSPEPRLLLWRSIAWGTDGPATAHPAEWERDFLDRVQAMILPTADAIPTPVLGTVDSWAVADDDSDRPAIIIDWSTDPESYGSAVEAEIGDGSLIRTTETHGAAALPALVKREQEIVGNLDAEVHGTWREIGGSDSRSGRTGPLEALQRLAQQRPSATGGPGRIEELHDSTRDRIAQRLLRLDAIKRHRDRVLHEATPTLALARAKFVPLWWRGLIGVAVTLSVLALMLGVLVPLRPKALPPVEGSSFMGMPLRGRSVAFLVDRSGSMQGPRLEKLKSDLTEAIESLPIGTKFTIAAFSSDTTYLPGGEGGLVPLTHASKKAAVDWIATLEAKGHTLAADGLRRLVGAAPSEIILLTDGAIEDSGKVEEIVEGLGADTKLRINTIAFYGDSGEDFLREISKATSGTHAFVPFDPFDPPGFPWALALVIAATALGACCGVFVPWWLERRAGRAAAKVLAECVRAVRADHDAQLNEGRAIVASAGGMLSIREKVAVGVLQRSLGARAMQVVRGLFAAAGNEAGGRSTGRRGPSHGRLWEEDRSDLRRLLDVPLDGPNSGGRRDGDEAIAGAAAKAAANLLTSWRAICVEHDAEGRCGNVPTDAIVRVFGTVLRRAMGSWPLMLLLRRPTIDEDRSVDRKSTTALAAELENTLGDDANSSDLLSAPIDQDVPTLLSECRRRQWIELTCEQVVRAADRTPARLQGIYHRMRVECRETVESAFHRTFFESPDGGMPVGIPALGLVHEEIRIRIVAPVDPVEGGRDVVDRTEAENAVGGAAVAVAEQEAVIMSDTNRLGYEIVPWGMPS